MDPPPLPKNQDCHELWSKNRKRQLKEQQDATVPNSISSKENSSQGNYLSHKESRSRMYRGDDGNCFNEGRRYEGCEDNGSLPTSSSNSPNLSRPQMGNHTPTIDHRERDGMTPPSHEHQYPSTPPDEEKPLFHQLQHINRLIESKQTVMFGHFNNLMKEQVCMFVFYFI